MLRHLYSEAPVVAATRGQAFSFAGAVQAGCTPPKRDQVETKDERPKAMEASQGSRGDVRLDNAWNHVYARHCVHWSRDNSAILYHWRPISQ